MELLQTTQVLAYHRGMLADTERVDRYHEAIHETVRPGDVVVDIGSGTGLLAYFACQAGARRVYAIEAGAIIGLAREICHANGFDDRVVFIHDHSSRVTLPEPADLLITETLWNFGIGEGVLGFLADARARMLKPGARVIPLGVDLFLAPLQLDGYYDALVLAPADRHDLDFSALRAYSRNQVQVPRVDPAAFLAPPACLTSILFDIGADREVSATADFRVAREGTLHGFAGWFDARLTDRVRLGNVPPAEGSSWAHVLFPTEAALRVSVDDEVSVRIDSVANGTVWRWSTTAGGRRFDQTTLFGFPFDPATQALRAGSARPLRSELGDAASVVLNLLNGKTAVEEVVEEVGRRFDTLFHDSAQASEFVRELAERYGS